MKCEILAPAGGEQSAYAALNSGADAIYLGLTQFSARAGAENFDLAALGRVTEYAHVLGAKVYVALNTLVKEGEAQAFFSAALSAWNAGADAILLQDLFLGKRLNRAYPQMALHLSTQAGCCNEYGARLAKEYGFSRAVLARETPLAEIERISKIIQTEVFVQGALCSCFSGQCYFSSFAGNNSGNRGRCKQPCRKKYSIDRKGFEEYAYALSPSDLSVGERVAELLAAGAFSFKIEGRMRRPEYVASAVAYYRALIDGKKAEAEKSRLARAYNRGDYTQGLAFGQKKDFLSREVQGHIGERVGTLSLRKGKYFCESAFRARQGDCFKVLRVGKEAGGGAFASAEKDGFYLRSSAPLKAGDEVRVTTDTAAGEIALSFTKKRKISLDLSFEGGKAPVISCGTFIHTAQTVCGEAINAPLKEADICACFLKTDGLPFAVSFGEVHVNNAFLPKSALNGIRRDFYEKLIAHLAPARSPLAARQIAAEQVVCAQGNKRAVLGSDYRIAGGDVFIYRPCDYAHISAPPQDGREFFLYLPPLFTQEDEQMIGQAIALFDGIYCEGSYGIALAQKYGKPLFAGAGFNLTNAYAVNGVKEAGAKYYVLSKELTNAEQRALAGEGAFALCAGGIKLMDLCYCPFGGSCGCCDKREYYRMTDEEDRQFLLRRYRLSGNFCRFEVYNCASLAAYNGRTSLFIDTAGEKNASALPAAAHSPDRVKSLVRRATAGHADKSLL